MSKQKKAIQPTRRENYPEWYQQVIKAADLAEHAPVRGCMIIKPWGYGLWENIQKILDRQLKQLGNENAYFPLLIPLSYFEKESEHIEGFAKECAVVTHHRLEKDQEGRLQPAGKLEEPLIVRPTSEMMIGQMFSKWIESYRDLPYRINQWANVMRWEMRTRLFLRTSEFLWQEGHTVHATKEEAEKEALKMLDVYAKFCWDYLAIPVHKGEKTERERFPGAVKTWTIEGMMQDGKALQCGTSHFLGQNFAKSCEIRYRDENGQLQYAWTTSWGLTTRLIGAMIMTHSDDDGLILPPKIAPKQIVILPVIHKEEDQKPILNYCEQLKRDLKKISFNGSPLEVTVDNREMRGGEKKWAWIKKGIPIRIEIGKRELDEKKIFFLRRDDHEKSSLAYADFIKKISQILEDMQKSLLEEALKFRNTNTHELSSKEEFINYFKNKDSGFAICHWHKDEKLEEKIQKDLGVTIRCIPEDLTHSKGTCIFSKKPTSQKVLFAKSY